MARRTSCCTAGGGGHGMHCWHDPVGSGWVSLGGASELRRGGHVAGAAVALVDGGVLLHLLRQDLVHGPHQPLEGFPPHGQQLHLRGRGEFIPEHVPAPVLAVPPGAILHQAAGSYVMACIVNTTEHVGG